MNTRRSGELGERVAEAFLAIKGFEVVGKNVRFCRREIDILAFDGDVLVAVEVKLRRSRRFGMAAEAIDRRKVKRIQTALGGIIRDNGLNVHSRMDVVTIDLDNAQSRMTVEHIVGVY